VKYEQFETLNKITLVSTGLPSFFVWRNSA